MGWGKGKGKQLEKALHRAERQEEWAAEKALARGDVFSAVTHAKNAEALEQAEHAVHRKGKGKGKGKGYHSAEVVVVPSSEVVVVNATPLRAPPAEVVVVTATPLQAAVTTSVQPEVVVVPAAKGYKGVGKATEHALHREEKRQEVAVGAALARGDVVSATVHAEKAAELHAAERAVHQEVVHAKVHQAHHQENRQHHLAARDLAHGNILGALAHEVKAENAHRREQRLEKELAHENYHHHHHHKGKGKGWW